MIVKVRGELERQSEMFSYVDLNREFRQTTLSARTERIDYDLLFRWFVGLGMDDEVWSHSVFSKNQGRLLTYGIDELLFQAIKNQAYANKLLSQDRFSLDGTRNVRLYREGSGKEAKLHYMGHVLTENRNGLIDGATLTEAKARIGMDGSG